MTSAPVSAAPAGSGSSGTLTVVHPSSPSALDPQATLENVVWSIDRHIFDPLVDRDATGNIVPALATSWSVVDDSTWKFSLRPNVRFHDGEPFTSDSVKYTFARVQDPNTKSPQAAVWQDIATVDTPDPLTAVVHTKQPIGPLLNNLTSLYMLPPQAASASDFGQKLPGTGPFKFVSWAKGDRVTLQSNAEYWGGPPKFGTLVFRTIPEESTRVSALANGEVDLVMQLAAEALPGLKGTPDITVDTVNSIQERALWMNAGRPPFDNVKLRQAIYGAIDTKQLVDVMGGLAIPARGMIAPGIFGYDADLPPHPYDADKAKQMVADAGFPNGVDVTFKIAPIYTKQQDVAENIVAQLAKIGVRAKLQVEETAVWTKELLALDWDLNLVATGPITGDADFELARLYLSANKRTGYVNPQLDALLLKGRQSIDPQTRIQAYKGAQALLYAEGPALYLFYGVDAYGVRNRVKGFVPRPDQLLIVKDAALQ